MGVPQRTRAVLLDALGTLLYFDPPAPHLRDALRERLGRRGHPADAAAAAIKAEIAYYRAHLHEGRDAASLADLRRRSAEAMRPALGLDASTERFTEALLAALRFRAYPDAAPALLALRSLGLRTVVVSNWDHSLHERLAETGLAPLVDGAVASAELGHAKPERAIFEHALEPRRRRRRLALHAGDSPRRTSRARSRPACVLCWSRATARRRRRRACRSSARSPSFRPVRVRLKRPVTSVPPSFQHPGSPPSRPELPEGAPVPEPPAAACRPSASPWVAVPGRAGGVRVRARGRRSSLSSWSSGGRRRRQPDRLGRRHDRLHRGARPRADRLRGGVVTWLARPPRRRRPRSACASRDWRSGARLDAGRLRGFWFCAVVVGLVFGQPEEQDIVTDLKAEDSALVLIGFALMTCLLAPLAEEFFFRGFLFRVLHEKTASWPRWRSPGSPSARPSPERRLDRHDRPRLFGVAAVRAVPLHGVPDSVHHVARVPQLDLVRRHEGAALVGIPAADRRGASRRRSPSPCSPPAPGSAPRRPCRRG